MSRLMTPGWLVGLLIGMAATVYGFVTMPAPVTVTVWTLRGAMGFAGFLAMALLLLAVLVRRWSFAPWQAAALLAVPLMLVGSGMWPLLVCLWLGGSSWLLGDGLLRRFDNRDGVISLLAGAALYGTAIGLLAHWPVNYPATYALLLALPVAVRPKAARQLLMTSATALYPAAPRVTLITQLRRDGVALVTAALALVYLATALMPELGADALATHLFIPAHLSLRHMWGYDATTYIWAYMPLLGDWLYSLAYMLGGETAARLLNAGAIILLALLARRLAVWALAADAAASIMGANIATLLLLSTPLAFAEGSSLFIESIWACMAVGGTLEILRARNAATVRHLVTGGLLLGAAAATKGVTLTMLPLLALIVLWRARRLLTRRGIAALLLGAGLFLLLGLVPYLTAWLQTGNPVFPFYNDIFKSALYPPQRFDSGVAQFGQGLEWNFPYVMAFHAGMHMEAPMGAGGFYGLLLLPALFLVMLCGLPDRLMRRHYRRPALLLALVIGMAWLVCQNITYLRYIFPCYVLLAAVTGALAGQAMIAPSMSCARLATGMVIALAVVANLAFFCAGSFYSDFPLGSILSPSQRQAYLIAHRPLRSAVQAVNGLNTGRSPVAVFANDQTAGIEADILHPSWYNPSFMHDFTIAQNAPALGGMLARRQVRYVLLDSGWGSSADRKRVEDATLPLATIGTVAIRQLDSVYSFSSQLVQNSIFITDGAATSPVEWSPIPKNNYDAAQHSVSVTATQNMSQKVAVTGGASYRETASARCAGVTDAQGRLQINWLNAKGTFISCDIKTFTCTPDWSPQVMEGTAPPDAAAGIVYVSGHMADPVLFQSLELRQ